MLIPLIPGQPTDDDKPDGPVTATLAKAIRTAPNHNASAAISLSGEINKRTDPKAITMHAAQKVQASTVMHSQQVSLASIGGQSQHGNIILVRGARTENGQIILQNSQELLNLFSDDDKPIILQNSRLRAAKASSESTILLQSALKGTHIIDACGTNAISAAGTATNGNTVLLQSAVKKTTGIPEGSIIVQQRLNKNGTSDGPILLQTLKRLDKSPSILVFRNPNGTATTATLATKATLAQRTMVTLAKEEPEEKVTPTTAADVIVTAHPAKNTSQNVPLGSGEYPGYLSFSISYSFSVLVRQPLSLSIM